MVAGTREDVFRQSLEKLVIFGAKLAEGFERLRNLASLVVQMVRPQLAVEGLQRGIVLGRDLTDAHHADSLRIRQVAYDLPDAPLIGSRFKIELRPGRARGGHRQQFTAAAEALQDI